MFPTSISTVGGVLCADHWDPLLTPDLSALCCAAQVGLSGVGKLFTHEVLKAMGEAQEQPIIMAMSNPISRLECTHASAQAATGGSMGLGFDGHALSPVGRQIVGD